MSRIIFRIDTTYTFRGETAIRQFVPREKNNDHLNAWN